MGFLNPCQKVEFLIYARTKAAMALSVQPSDQSQCQRLTSSHLDLHELIFSPLTWSRQEAKPKALGTGSKPEESKILDTESQYD